MVESLLMTDSCVEEELECDLIRRVFFYIKIYKNNQKKLSLNSPPKIVLCSGRAAQ